MGDSDDERGGSDPGIDLTGFLFGNIDESGQLENDVLDNESKRHLASLGRLGLSSLLEEMIGGDVKEKKLKSESDSDEDGDLRDHDHAQEAHHRHEHGESNKDETLHGLPSILASWNLDE